MLKYELKKVLGRPVVWGIMLGIMVINVLFFCLLQPEKFSRKEYKSLWSQYEQSGKTVEKEIQMLEESKRKLGESEAKKSSLYEQLLLELNSIAGYGTYRQQIQRNVQKMSLLSSFNKSGSFALKNIEKTGEHFAKMPMVSVKAAPSVGVEKFFSLHTACLAVILLLYFGYLLFVQESENGIATLLKTTYHGKIRLCISKFVAHFLSMLVIVVLLYGSNYFVLQYLYGLGNLSRSIQSVLAYVSCGTVMSVGGFLLSGVVLLVFLLLALLIILDAICVISEHAILSFLSTIVLTVLLLVIHCFIPLNSYLGWLKYLSPTICLNVGEVIGKYVNLNLFGVPVTYCYVTIILYGIISLLGFFLMVVFFCKIRKKSCKSNWTWPKRRKRRKKYSFSLFYFEFFKIRKTGHTFLVVVFFLAMSVLVSYRGELLFEDEDEFYYYTYMKELAGNVSEAKKEYLKDEDKRFQNIRRNQQKMMLSGKNDEFALNEISKALHPYVGFCRAKEKRDFLEKYKLSTYVYESGYKQLFSMKDNKENLLLLLMGMLLLAFLLSPVFAADKEQNMEELLSLTKNGHSKRTKSKFLCAGLLCVGTFFVLYAPQFVTFCRLYGLAGIGAPVQCIGKWLRVGIRVPIWIWMLIMYYIRLLVLGGISGVILLVSNRTKSIFVTIMIFVLLAILVGGFLVKSGS